jgi:RecA-family ATPase
MSNLISPEQEIHTHQQLPTTTTMAEIMRMEFPPLEYVIPEILPTGLTLLSGKPKLGKSWMVCDLANAKAMGGCALQQYQVTQSDVLYLAMEDSFRRLQRRNIQLVGADTFPENLHCATEWPRLGNGGSEALHTFVDRKPETGLVVVDTFAIIRPRTRTTANMYEADYNAMRFLHEFATNRDVSVIVVHHTRKGESEDVHEMASGSNGLTGACDSLIVLKRGRGEADGELHVTSRDAADQELAMQFNASCGQWTVMGNAAEYSRTVEERDTLTAMRELGPASAKVIAEALDETEGRIKTRLSRMKDRNRVRNPNRGVWVVTPTPVTDVTV